MNSSSSALPFSYDEFSSWFDKYSQDFLAPAQEAAVAALNEHLDAELQEPQRVRIRVGVGRVKSRARAWKKLNDKYADKVAAVSEIPRVMDDLVGLRVVCTNKSDVDRLVEILDALDEYRDGEEPVLARHPGSLKDWRLDPKASGYRAYHINLCTSVSHATTRHPIVCELQIRTLLQDSWGELTHEDTYKPGTEVPPLVDTLSKRMADLMATLDDIAEDLRSQLDSIADDSLAREEGDSDEPSSVRAADPSNPTRDAAEAFLRERIESLTWPMPGPTLAWELQREFGGEISDGWLGYGTFTKMLYSVVSPAQISPTDPTFVLPADFDITLHSGRHPGFPSVVSLVKDADKGFPLISSKHWPRIYSAVAAATHQVSWSGSPDIRTLNEITRVARDAGDAALEERVSRVQAHYVGLALLNSYRLITDMTAGQVEQAFVEWMRSRSESLGFPEADSKKLESWIQGKGS
jgi:ppGpp synthetase/RelA/SpoT-type nucleotidyltranferase